MDSYGRTGSGQWGEVTQLDAGYLDAATTLVTLSIGGNDIRFGPIVSSCIGTLNLNCMDSKALGETRTLYETSVDDTVKSLPVSISVVLQEIKKKAPNAKIVLMEYPKVLEEDKPCFPNLSAYEMPRLNDIAVRLTMTQQDIAAKAKADGINATFANPVTAFQGKSVCAATEAAFNGIMTTPRPGEKPIISLFGQPLGISAESFHPNQLGTSLYAGVLTQAVK